MKLPSIPKLPELAKLLRELPTLHDLPPWLLLEPTEHESERPQPTLALYRDPFVASGPCAEAKSVPDGLRLAVTESCPRCGAGAGGGLGRGGGEAACILQSLELDLRLLDDESTTETLRELVGRLEPRLV